MQQSSDERINREQSLQLFGMLSEPMPPEALKDDISRGFELTSIKAAYVLERLTLTYGLLGYGWRYATGPRHVEGNETLIDVAVQWRICEDPDEALYCRPIYWGRRTDPKSGDILEGWYPDNDRPAVWSEPILATGGSSINRKGSVPMTDASRSAVTNGLTKAASRLGVGIEIWKGQNDAPPPKNKKSAQRAKAKPPNSNAPEPADGNSKAPTLTGMQKAAQAQFERLEQVGDEPATKSDYAPLATLMKKLGLEMQVVRLLYVLLGKGDTTKRRVMAVHNFLQTPLSHEAVALLNAAAWEAPWTDAEEGAEEKE